MILSNDFNSSKRLTYENLTDTCKYHIVFIPKYRRKIIYNQYRKDLSEYIQLLCKYKGVKIIEGHMMPDHVHILVSIPPKLSGPQSIK